MIYFHLLQTDDAFVQEFNRRLRFGQITSAEWRDDQNFCSDTTSGTTVSVIPRRLPRYWSSTSLG